MVVQTIVVLLEKDKVHIDEKYFRNTANDIETKDEVWQYNRNKIKRLANRKFYRYINPKIIHVNKYSQI